MHCKMQWSVGTGDGKIKNCCQKWNYYVGRGKLRHFGEQFVKMGSFEQVELHDLFPKCSFWVPNFGKSRPPSPLSQECQEIWAVSGDGYGNGDWGRDNGDGHQSFFWTVASLMQWFVIIFEIFQVSIPKTPAECYNRVARYNYFWNSFFQIPKSCLECYNRYTAILRKTVFSRFFGETQSLPEPKWCKGAAMMLRL